MIDVLLATYRPNPKWLKEQIDSIRAQRGVAINLIEREDEEGLGACQNFAALLEESRADYIAFSDQDDVWLPNKLERMMAKVRELENRWGKDAPLLVFSDLTVVDTELKVIDQSLFRRSRLDPRRVLPRQLALQNVANGNAMLFNAALRERVCPIPAGAVMHDHWTVLISSVFGHIACLREPTVLYRQHEKNVFGGADVGVLYFLRRAMQGRKALRERLYANIRQAEAFVERFGSASPCCLKALVGLRSKPYPLRVLALIRRRVFKNGLLRNLGTWAVV